MPSSAAKQFEHALVVGGTGMLAEATRFIRVRSARMTLVARRPEISGVALSSDEALSVDWSNEAVFSAALSSRIAAIPPDLVLLWIHSNGESALLWLIKQLVTRHVLVVHVLGSSAGDPRGGNADINTVVAKAPWMHYVTVVLGSKALPSGRRRWLTNCEISGGAVEAIQSGSDIIVGEIIPAR